MPATKAKARGPRPSRPRHREGTRAALVAAVGEVLLAEGAPALTPSAVAQRAGVDKALVYRYFGGLDGLVREYGRSPDFWPTVEEIVGDRAALLALPLGDRLSAVMQRYAGALRARPATVAILAAELVEPTAVHRRLEAVREELGLALLALAADWPPELDLPAVATLLTGAVHYLLVRARQVAVFNGIPIATDSGWARIAQAIDAVARATVAAALEADTSRPARARKRRPRAGGRASSR